ncbi:hypothetical protein B6U99_02200 [Candidatus Geothermarchaeota archaeon ex4572_27]|nr:MAG: hypothetical protein B6U99_02200 [Candidatus Geothermarchaeota archaeon ex4572_27]
MEDFNEHEAQLAKLREDFNRPEAENVKQFQAVEGHSKHHGQELARLRGDMIKGLKLIDRHQP